MKLSTYANELESTGISIHFLPRNEDISIPGHFDSKETEDKIIEDYNQGNDAAWFCAEVNISYAGLTSDSEYLGACSYESFDQFTGTDNDYFDDMLKTCYKNLKIKIAQIKKMPELA